MAITGVENRVLPGLDFAGEVAQQLRVDGIRASTKAGSGHPTSSMSAADLIAVLGARYLRYDFARPDNPNNDHLIFSKGHASPLLYAFYKACGAVTNDELMPDPRFYQPIQPGDDVAGQDRNPFFVRAKSGRA